MDVCQLHVIVLVYGVVKFEFYVALQTTFGNSKTSPCTSKKSFAFLVQFLSDIVPYETGRYLKVIIPHCIIGEFSARVL